MAITIEVLEHRPYKLTDNRYGVAKYPMCNTLGCIKEATIVVTSVKFERTFHEPMCPECAKRFPVGQVSLRRKPQPHEKGAAAFFNTNPEEFISLPTDDQVVLYRFIDAYRKEDMTTLELLIKDNKSLIKRYFQPEAQHE